MSGVASGSLRHFSFPVRPFRSVPWPSPSPAATAQALQRSRWSRITSPPCCGVPCARAASATATCSPVRAASARPRRRASSRWRSTAPIATPEGDPCGECETCSRIWSGGGQSRRGRDRRRQQPRCRRRARPAGARHVRGVAGGAPQGLHRGRGAHAHARGVECAPQDPRGAAAAAWCSSSPPPSRRRSRRPRHRCCRGCSGSTSAASGRPPSANAPHRGARGGGHPGRRRRAHPHRASRRRRHARRALAARPVPELRRGARSRRPACARCSAWCPTSSYDEVLRLVVERDAAGVFTLVERLLDLRRRPGRVPDGAVGDAARAAHGAGGGHARGPHRGGASRSSRATDALVPGDMLRMLKLLAESETSLRRSANARLVVETLLLRWVMLDRLVDLQAVLEGGAPPQRPRLALRRPARRPARRPRPRQRSHEAPRRPLHRWLRRPRPSRRRPRRRPGGRADSPSPGRRCRAPGPTSWLRRARRARSSGRRSPRAELARRGGARDRPRMTDADAGHGPDPRAAEERLAGLLGRIVGTPVDLRLAGGDSQASGAKARPKRLSDQALRADRLKGLRARDPALDAAADALDLEIVD